MLDNHPENTIQKNSIPSDSNNNSEQKKTFEDLLLPSLLLKSIQKMQFQQPTPIQEATIPVALQGQDILGSAQTGTGKTAAFSIPILAKMLTQPQGKALILTPTRELAKQILDFIHQLIPREKRIQTALLIGGNPIEKQFFQLKKKPRILIGTPGRVNDHLERQSLSLEDIRFLVLDETDCMLDMGFGQQLAIIKEYLPEDRQTLLFSATMPENIVKIAATYLKNPQRIAIGATQTTAVDIKQSAAYMKPIEKYPRLLKELDERTEGAKIIFVKTKIGAERLYEKIREDKNYRLDFIHGGLNQRRRDRIMKKFKTGYISILIATDVAARGLDIPHIEHVINYDLPQCPEDYIHRIGRTGRAGKSGEAICFVTPNETMQWKQIALFLKKKNLTVTGNVPIEESPYKKSFQHRKRPFHHTNSGQRNGYTREKRFDRKTYNR